MPVGCIVAGRAPQTNLVQLDEHRFAFEIERAELVNHFGKFSEFSSHSRVLYSHQKPISFQIDSFLSVVFLLDALPPSCGVAVFTAWSDEWKFVGHLSNEKPSAIFKLARSPRADEPTIASHAPHSATIGIALESIEVIDAHEQSNRATMSTRVSPDATAANATVFTQVLFFSDLFRTFSLFIDNV